jgi:hypothetical protein
VIRGSWLFVPAYVSGLRGVRDTSWAQNTLTWNNQPAIGDVPISKEAPNFNPALIGAWNASPLANAYVIHVDHLNTPRAIFDANQQVIWRNDNIEPFGDSVPDENPSGLGAFEFPMMLSLYYRDKETGNFYAMQRDAYSPAIGRFPQSDLPPIISAKGKLAKSLCAEYLQAELCRESELGRG